MNIRPNFSENSPSYIERPSSNFIDDSDECTRYSQPYLKYEPFQRRVVVASQYA